MRQTNSDPGVLRAQHDVAAGSSAFAKFRTFPAGAIATSRPATPASSLRGCAVPFTMWRLPFSSVTHIAKMCISFLHAYDEALKEDGSSSEQHGLL